MPISVNLLELGNGSLHLEGELPAEELDLAQADELIHPNQPLVYDLRVEKEPDGLLVRGRLSTVLDCECARCLAPFSMVVENANFACMLVLNGEDKVVISNDCVDLTPLIREDIVLAFPQHPLCNPDCQGLKPPSSTGSGSLGTKGGLVEGSTPWSELDKLSF